MPGDEITLCCLLQRHLGHVGGSVKLEVVPEPSILSLLGLGAGALAVWRRSPKR